jgi:dihydroxyacetone kinase-like protein
MADTIGYEEMTRMIHTAGEKIRIHCDELSKMDAATGDGDHGTTIVRAMDIADKIIREDQSGIMKSLLKDVGWGIMGVDGGATGPLLGSFLMGLSDGIDGRAELDGSTFSAMLESGLVGVQKRTKAQVGDKTMMDALVPAVDSFSESIQKEGTIRDSLVIAAEAAEKGAISTKDFKARFGRAKNLGDRTLGCQDPGATSMALIFWGFAEAVS